MLAVWLTVDSVGVVLFACLLWWVTVHARG